MLLHRESLGFCCTQPTQNFQDFNVLVAHLWLSSMGKVKCMSHNGGKQTIQIVSIVWIRFSLGRLFNALVSWQLVQL